MPMKTLAALLLGAASILPGASAFAQEVKQLNVIMPLPRSANFYPLIAGEALGYFEEEGVSVNLLPSSTAIPFIAFVQNGQADIAMLDAPQTFQAAQSGADFKIVYEVMQRAPEGIFVSAESPYKDVAELKGTTVGLVADRDRTTLTIALDARGASIDDVTTVVVGEAGPTLAAAVRDNTVSAISGAVPDWLSMQAAGLKIRTITPEEVSVQPANSFAVSGSRMEELKEPLEGFFRAWSKGMIAADYDPDAVAAMTKAAVPEEWASDEFGRAFFDASVPMNRSQTERLGDLQAQVWKDVQPPMIKVGAIDGEVDPSTFLDDRFIGPANDFDREKVKADVAAWKEANM
ncbi:ABC transporter substrate-binding protein [Antarcticirhabdus aurantiaca]|uniref:ABC transporter substrate-binding protein n=1 Tax=Antarcticirhabdus aurantiaca TaxID=2606717 RepID=A0ACD4NHW9_9HYPH|nr:ABC transporter substrate-binding protein [Antarcticirhabdus aurantiaca]WAJ26378.1 ABC transporter substrate-binding protein [Jeongeuplla avenae]